MSTEIVLNRLPNVYIDKIMVSEVNNSTVIIANVSLMDIGMRTERKWPTVNSIRRIMVNMSLVENNTDITAVKNRSVVLEKKDCVSVLASKYSSVSTQNGKIKYGYKLRISLKRKISNDSSLFFFTTRDRDKANKSRNTKKPNHGIFNVSKKTKGRLRKDRIGGIKHVPIFKGGSKIKKIEVYRSRTTGLVWHGEVKFSVGRNSFYSNTPGLTNMALNKEMIDNNIIIYNMPIKKLKDNNRKLFPIRKQKYKKNKKIKKLNSLHNRAYMYELDEQIDPNGNMHKMFMVNLCNIALSKSRTAQKIYRVDKDLFMQLGETLSVGKIKVERSVFKNLARVKKSKKSKYKKNRKKLNTRKNRNKKIIVNKNMRKRLGLRGLLNQDDMKFKKPIKRRNASLKIVDAGLPSEIKTLYLIDYDNKKKVKGRLSYKVTLDFDDVYHRHVKTVLKNIINFKKELSNIKNSVVKTRAYKRTENRIKGSYIQKYFRKFNVGAGVSLGAGENLSNSPIINGIAAVDSASILLGMEPEDLQIDASVNLSNTTPKTLERAMAHLGKVIHLLKRRFNIVETFDKATGRGKSLRGRKSNKRRVVATTFNLKVETQIKKEFVKYELINFNREIKIDKTSLESRINTEVNKYFDGGAPVNSGILGNKFDNQTRANLINIQENKYQFLTPSAIHYGKDKVNTSRFDKKINIRFFNKVKMTRKKVISNKNTKSLRPKLRQSLPFMIQPENNVPVENRNEDILTARKFLGTKSPFLNKRLIKRRGMKLKNMKSIEKISNSFIFDKKTVKSISTYDLDNSNNIIYDRIVDKNIDPLSIPLQIKSLIFNKSDVVRTNFLSNKDDIFKNTKTDEIAYQMYGNIFQLKYVDDFSLSKDGLYDMKRPIIKNMTGNNYQSLNGSNKVCLFRRFNDKMVMSKKDPFTTFGTVFLLVDRGQAPISTKGMTSHNANHHHKYVVDKNGNGYTMAAVHPDNPNIRHRHKIINYVVQEAKSSCYPNCKDRYGVEGAPPHGHALVKRMSMSKVRTKEQIARRYAANFNPSDAQLPLANNANTTQTTTTMSNNQETANNTNPVSAPSTGGMSSGY